MNTRLQVEHPVTEMITGIDLVEEQIRIARGEKLRYCQEDLQINGHAIELRVYAEDPLNKFLPSIGTLTRYEKPSGPGIRVDDGYEEGMEIPIYYDPMIAKLAVHGGDRTEAIQKMKEAIRAYRIEGVATTLPFGTFVFGHDAFISGHFDTHFVQKYYTPDLIRARQESNAEIAALAAIRYWMETSKRLRAVENTTTSWKRRLAK
jgi:propionyl-CoA carboxylase alpha chain